MNKAHFLTILKRSLKFRAVKQTVRCRCADCYSAKQIRQDKGANTSSKRPCVPFTLLLTCPQNCSMLLM